MRKEPAVTRLREDLHRYRLLIPCALAAVLLLRWFVMRGRPERLIELPLGSLTQWIGIADGKAITFGASPDGADLVASAHAIGGGKARQIVRHSSGDTEIGGFISGRYFYFVNVWHADG